MVSKVLIDFVNNDLEWWDDANKEVFHKACGTMLASGINEDKIKQILQDLYSAVSAEYGN